ncbi:MAG: hypothetical protein JW908_16455 [Anaerolineales bacterium]|nr:hypothetical protein [Anaerolineales bacterium]
MKLISWLTKGSRALFFALLASLFITGIALATFITINTTDGSIDSAWSATPFLTDPDDVPTTGMDIYNFWVGTDSTKSNFYFRAELDARMPATGPGGGFTWVEAWLDCDRDGTMESTDVVVQYMDNWDNVYTYEGSKVSYDSYLSSYGEYISSYNYEWYSPTSGGNVDWSACKSGNINVALLTYENPSGTPIIFDQTDWRGLDTSTAVQIQDLHATSKRNAYVALLIVIGLFFVSGFALWRTKTLKS